MDRRNLLKTTAAAAGTLVMGQAFAEDHKHHHHGGGKKVEIKDGVSKKSAKKIVESTEECLEAGKECLHHCRSKPEWLLSWFRCSRRCAAGQQSVL
jgi:hypothetical protein